MSMVGVAHSQPAPSKVQRAAIAAASGRADKAETARIEAFSDGVVAIALTLLGLELRAPFKVGVPLSTALANAWPSYVGFFISFVTIMVIWINHHRLFTHIVHVDHGLLLLNGLLLMTVSIVPFGTAILAEHFVFPDERRTAAMLYSAVFVALTTAFNAVWRHAARRHRLLDRAVDKRTIRRINFQYGFGPVLYIGSMALALVAPGASVAADLVFVAFFALPLLNWSRAIQVGLLPHP